MDPENNKIEHVLSIDLSAGLSVLRLLRRFYRHVELTDVRTTDGRPGMRRGNPEDPERRARRQKKNGKRPKRPGALPKLSALATLKDAFVRYLRTYALSHSPPAHTPQRIMPKKVSISPIIWRFLWYLCGGGIRAAHLVIEISST